MPTIKYSDNPNEETAFVTQDGGQRNRAVLTAAVDGTIEYSNNPNSTKVMVTVDGVKRRAVAVADISGGGGGSSYTAGTGIDITNGTISVKAPTLQNTAAASYSLSVLGSPATGARSINIGQNSSTGFASDSVAIGYNSSASSGVAIGSGAKATGMFSIQIGTATNTDTKTVKFFNGNANYEIMSADGTIPAARHASLPAADGTYTLQLVIADGVPTLSWVAE